MDFPSSDPLEISSPAEALRLDNAASKGFLASSEITRCRGAVNLVKRNGRNTAAVSSRMTKVCAEKSIILHYEIKNVPCAQKL